MKSFYTIIFAFASVQTVFADLDVDANDVPAICQSICRPTLELSRTCDVSSDLVGSDLAEFQGEQACFCQNTSFDVGRITALCQSCVQQNALEADDRREIDEIMTMCAFGAAQFTAADATSADAVVVTAAAPVGQDVDVPDREDFDDVFDDDDFDGPDFDKRRVHARALRV